MLISELKRFAPAGKAAILSGIADHWHVAETAGINTPLRICHFLAQLAHESDGFKTAREYASGAAYEGRKDLGNTEKGDGTRYRGRGLIQLTGRANYRAAGRDLGLDLEGDPKLAERPDVIMQIAVWYWTTRGLNRFADKNDIRSITKRINGGFNGLADRRAKLRAAVEIWGEGEVDPAGRSFASTNTTRAALLGGPVVGFASIGEYAWQAQSAIESGKSISEAFGVSFFTLFLIVAVAGLVGFILYDRWFIRKYEGL